uniref:Uncharacterized protein n=1 Tax=Rhizophora mucronata TaxID=61149 RepID=A0A2P2N1Y0_RHIMU
MNETKSLLPSIRTEPNRNKWILEKPIVIKWYKSCYGESNSLVETIKNEVSL